MKDKKQDLFVCHSIYASPLGNITMMSDGTFLTGLVLPNQGVLTAPNITVKADHLDIFKLTKNYLDAYFKGEKHLIVPPLRFKGTPFQELVWFSLLELPYGSLITYGELAKMMASKRGLAKMSSQAIGQAVGRNPISIVIPCHRVIGANNHLIGYGGGLILKRKLLSIEGHDINRYIG